MGQRMQRHIGSGIMSGLMGLFLALAAAAGFMDRFAAWHIPLFLGGIGMFVGGIGLGMGARWARFVMIPGALLVGLSTLPSIFAFGSDPIAILVLMYCVWIVLFRCFPKAPVEPAPGPACTG